MPRIEISTPAMVAGVEIFIGKNDDGPILLRLGYSLP